MLDEQLLAVAKRIAASNATRAEYRRMVARLVQQLEELAQDLQRVRDDNEMHRQMDLYE